MAIRAGEWLETPPISNTSCVNYSLALPLHFSSLGLVCPQNVY